MTLTQVTETVSVEVQQQAEAISKFEALQHDIAIAAEESLTKHFDYESKQGNKQARSWIAELRRIKASIERARKAAKDVHLQRGRAVDAAAKRLEADVLALIEPHDKEIKAIEAKEEARVAAHRAVLDRIAQLAENVATSAEAQERLLELAAIDVESLEEFGKAGASRQAEAEERLQQLLDELRIREAERAELEALRAEKAAQQEAERIEQIRQEVAAEALVAAAEAERRAQEAEQRAMELEARVVDPQGVAAPQKELEQIEALSLRDDLVKAIAEAMAGKNRLQIADAIVDGRLHPVICIDWTKVWPLES
jgi:colicin import membrane protein